MKGNVQRVKDRIDPKGQEGYCEWHDKQISPSLPLLRKQFISPFFLIVVSTHA